MRSRGHCHAHIACHTAAAHFPYVRCGVSCRSLLRVRRDGTWKVINPIVKFVLKDDHKSHFSIQICAETEASSVLFLTSKGLSKG